MAYGRKWRPSASQRREFAIKMQDPLEKQEYDFCLKNLDIFKTREDVEVANAVMSGYICNDKVDHDFIHIVNEKKHGLMQKFIAVREKTYVFVFEDRQGNEIRRDEITAFSLPEARRTAKRVAGESNLNDLYKIITKRK